MGQVVSMSSHKKKKNRRRRFFRIRVILFCLVCALIGFGISQSPLFNVKHINVSGNENVDSAYILQLSGIKEGQHIYSFRTGRAETMIETNAWVKSVKVKRILPNTVNIEISERTPVAAVAAGNGVLIVDEEGSVLTKQELFDGLPYMLIIGVDDLLKSDMDEQAQQEQSEFSSIKSESEGETESESDSKEKSKSNKSDSDTEINNKSENNADNTDSDNLESADKKTAENSEENSDVDSEENAESQSDEISKKIDKEADQADRKAYAAVKDYEDIVCGEKLNSEKLNSGLKVAMGMAEEEMSTVTQINVLDAQNIIMDTVYGIKIYFGDENDIKSKFDVVNTVLNDENQKGHITKIKYIDVSVPSHPALRYNN